MAVLHRLGNLAAASRRILLSWLCWQRTHALLLQVLIPDAGHGPKILYCCSLLRVTAAVPAAVTYLRRQIDTEPYVACSLASRDEAVQARVPWGHGLGTADYTDGQVQLWGRVPKMVGAFDVSCLRWSDWLGLGRWGEDSLTEYWTVKFAPI